MTTSVGAFAQVIAGAGAYAMTWKVVDNKCRSLRKHMILEHDSKVQTLETQIACKQVLLAARTTPPLNLTFTYS